MYPNLNAEQARKGLTNEEVAQGLNMKRQSYERKMQTGRFLVSECKTLCSLFHSNFEYLFETNDKVVPF